MAVMVVTENLLDLNIIIAYDNKIICVLSWNTMDKKGVTINEIVLE